MKVLRKGSIGPEVTLFQEFLRSRGLYAGVADGDFGPVTEKSVIKYQTSKGAKVVGSPDGVIGRLTWAAAIADGLPLVDETSHGVFPTPPLGVHALGVAGSRNLFGSFKYVAAPTKDNPEGVRVTDGWDDKNLTMVTVPQLVKLGLSKTGHATVHKLIAPQFLKLWKAWEDAGLLNLVVSWEGAYLARFIRGSRTSLSNHAFGSAFDINAEWNMRGTASAIPGKKGHLWPLVPIATEHGFFWGGWWGSEGRSGITDGMHFEAYKIVS